MRASDVIRTLTALVPIRRPIYLCGPPGVGKSSLIRQAAESMGRPIIDVRAVLLDPVDLRGLPCVINGTCVWVPPAFLPRGGEGVLFLDELAQAPPLVQAACLQLCLDRRVGEYELPDGWSIVAASNRQEDRAGTHRLITPLLNRFIHLDLDVSNEDWQAWAVVSGIVPEVRAFLKFKPDLLFNFDPSVGARAFPTPRSWEFVSQVFPHTPADLQHSVFAGCVGEGPATEFLAFLRIYQQLPDLDTLLANPSTAAIPKDLSVLCALSGALTERARNVKGKDLVAVIKYATRLPTEYSVLTMRDVVAVNRAALSLPESAVWLKTHRHLLLDGAA